MRREIISKIIAGTLISTTLCTLAPVRASAEWVNDYQNNKYYMQNNKKMTGWKRIDGQSYYFDDSGKMQTGWIKAEESWYFLQSNGALKTGWIKYNRNSYYADSSGAIQTGVINISGRVYIFDSNGVMKTNNTIINGEFYTIGLDGEVMGSRTPTPVKEFDDSGNCINVLKNTDNDKVTSPTYSKFNDVIEDQSEANAEEEEYYGVEYTITYKDSDGEKLKTKTVNKGKSIELYKPTKEGYNFAEWNTSSSGAGKSYDDGDKVKMNKDLTLYAQWEEDTTVYVEGISITGSSNVVINKTTQMTATVSPSDAENTSVTWTVEDGTGRATIDSNGLLTGVSSGTIKVIATANDGSGIIRTKEITVSETEVIVPVTAISVNSNTGASKITTSSGTLQMEASVTSTDASNKNVTWSVEDGTGRATIDSNGLLTAVSNGKVTVKATANDGSGVVGSKTITISGQSTKVYVESIAVNGKNNATKITTDGGTLQMSATVLPSSVTNSDVTWSVKDGTGSAIISSSGLLTALADGTVTVIATAEDGSKIIGIKEITISNQTSKATEIIVTGKNNIDAITNDAGTLQMEAEILPNDAADKKITWSVETVSNSGSGMTGKATISSDGLLTAVSNGTVKVIATAANGTGVYGSKVVTISGQSTKATAITITTEDGSTELATNGGTKLTLQMTAVVAPSTATNKTVTWSVIDKTGKATISSDGLLTAVSNGTVLVTATANDGSGISRTKLITISGLIVSVKEIAVSGEDSYETITKDKGTLQMNATITPSTATNKTITWSIKTVSDLGSGMTGNATISSDGLLTAVANGTVKVIATANDGSGIAKEKIITISGQITKVTGITVTASDSNNNNINTVAANKTLQMNAVVSPNDATNKAVTWSVSNVDGTSNIYAAIDTSGVLTGISVGAVKVTATAKDSSGEFGNTIINITSV